MAKILIIEDETELTRVLKSYLEKAGMMVIEAARGDTGLSLWEHERPDLVLLDLNLPGPRDPPQGGYTYHHGHRSR